MPQASGGTKKAMYGGNSYEESDALPIACAANGPTQRGSKEASSKRCDILTLSGLLVSTSVGQRSGRMPQSAALHCQTQSGKR